MASNRLSHGFGAEKIALFVTFFIKKQRFDAYFFLGNRKFKKKLYLCNLFLNHKYIV